MSQLFGAYINAIPAIPPNLQHLVEPAYTTLINVENSEAGKNVIRQTLHSILAINNYRNADIDFLARLVILLVDQKLRQQPGLRPEQLLHETSMGLLEHAACFAVDSLPVLIEWKQNPEIYNLIAQSVPKLIAVINNISQMYRTGYQQPGYGGYPQHNQVARPPVVADPLAVSPKQRQATQPKSQSPFATRRKEFKPNPQTSNYPGISNKVVKQQRDPKKDLIEGQEIMDRALHDLVYEEEYGSVHKQAYARFKEEVELAVQSPTLVDANIDIADKVYGYDGTLGIIHSFRVDEDVTPTPSTNIRLFKSIVITPFFANIDIQQLVADLAVETTFYGVAKRLTQWLNTNKGNKAIISFITKLDTYLTQLANVYLNSLIKELPFGITSFIADVAGIPKHLENRYETKEYLDGWTAYQRRVLKFTFKDLHNYRAYLESILDDSHHDRIEDLEPTVLIAVKKDIVVYIPFSTYELGANFDLTEKKVVREHAPAIFQLLDKVLLKADAFKEGYNDVYLALSDGRNLIATRSVKEKDTLYIREA
jgi:hypothetical protein